MPGGQCLECGRALRGPGPAAGDVEPALGGRSAWSIGQFLEVALQVRAWRRIDQEVEDPAE